MTRKAPIILTLATLTVALFAGAAPEAVADASSDDPTRIMENLFRSSTEGRRSGRIQMTLFDANGSERVRTLQVRSMRVADVRKSLLVIDSPADSRGVGFLTVEHDDPKQESERWLYLPNLGRSTRIARTQTSRAFMGSDFSYGDLSQPNPKLFVFSLTRASQVVDGEECWVIAAKPANAEVEHETGYKVSELWVSKSKLTPVRIRAQLVDGKTKYIRSSEFKQQGKSWLAHRVEARTVAGEKLVSKTVLATLAMESGEQVVTDADFTKQKLEQGL